MNIIFILDRQKRVIGYLSNNGAKPIAPFFNDVFSQELATGIEFFEFTTVKNNYTSKLMELGNYIVFMYDGKYKMFQLMDDNKSDAKRKKHLTRYCEGIGLELIGDFVEPFQIEGNINTFLEVVLQDTEFKIGHIDTELLNIIKNVKVTKTERVYKVIQENLSTFENIEIEFRAEFINNKFQGVYIDVYKDGNRGKKTNKRFETGENAEYVQRKSSLYDFASAGIGEGANGLNFKDIEWSIAKGDPCNKPLGQNFVVNPVANDKYNKGNKYIKKLYTFDTEDKRELLRLTYEALLQDAEPKNDYDVSLAMTTEEFNEVRIGDTVHVCDFYYIPAILLQARISKLEISFTNPKNNKCILSNYKELISKLSELEYNVVLGSMIDYINSLQTGLLTPTQIKQLTVYMNQLDFEEDEINKIISNLEQTAKDKFEEENRDKVKGSYLDLLLKNGRNYFCDRVKSIKYRLPSVADDDYSTVLKFTTEKDTEPTKFYQSTISWLEGDDCINGALIPKADTTYTLKIFCGDTTTTNKKYMGTVTKVKHGGSYAPYKNTTDYVKNIVECMKTYFDNKDKLKYNTKTPYSFKDPTTEANKLLWKSDGKYHIDCSSFVQFVTRGITYINSIYNHNDKSPYYLSNKYSYPFVMDATISDIDRYASDQARWCVENGLVLDISITDQSQWSKLQPGDLVFWVKRFGDEASFEVVAKRYLQVGHVAIVSEVGINPNTNKIDVKTYESTTGTPIKNRWLTDNMPEKLIFFARPRR